MNRIKIISSVLLWVFLGFLASKVNGQTKSEMKKEEIIKEAWSAMFGDLNSGDIRSLYVEGYFHGREIPNRTTIIRPDLFHNQHQNGVMVFDGKRAASQEYSKEEEEREKELELVPKEYWGHFQVDIALHFPAFFDYPSEYKGISSYQGGECFELYVELPMGGKVHYFIDVESFLVIRRLVSWDDAEEDTLWENRIDAYVDYGGILYPDGYSFEGQSGTEKGYFKNVRFNIQPDSSLFFIPPAVD